MSLQPLLKEPTREDKACEESERPLECPQPSDAVEAPPSLEVACELPQEAAADACVGPASDELPRSDVSALLDAICATRKDLETMGSAVGEISSQTGQILEMQRLAAEQSRRLGSKIDRAATAAAHAQFRDLINGLLLFYDLLSGLAVSAADPGAAAPGDGYRMLLRQLEQLLHVNGIEQIPAEGTPDYLMHRAVRKVPAGGKECDNRIVEVDRPGFRMGDQVLRPADVVVAVYEAQVRGEPAAAASTPSPCNGDGENDLGEQT